MFETAVVGDQVAVPIGGTYRISRIQSINQGIMTLTNGNRYRVANGGSLQSKWDTPLCPVTEEIRETVKRGKMLAQLNTMGRDEWNCLPSETLEQVLTLIKKERKDHA